MFCIVYPLILFCDIPKSMQPKIKLQAFHFVTLHFAAKRPLSFRFYSLPESPNICLFALLSFMWHKRPNYLQKVFYLTL